MRKSLAAVVVALVVVAPSAPSFAATGAKSTSTCSTAAAAAKAKAKKAKKVKVKFVYAGMLTAVGTDSITFTVHGGPDKALRGCPLTVAVTGTTKIVRDDVIAPLASLVAGDHVNVKGTKVGVAYTATRISAESPVVVAP